MHDAEAGRVVSTRVKICGISTIDEMWMAVRAGAAALGFVSQMPSGPGVISEEKIREIAPHIPPMVTSFLLTCLQSPDEIISQRKRCGLPALQLCRSLRIGDYRRLREEMPGIALVQVVHVPELEALDPILGLAPRVDALLLDSGRPHAARPELGGTGRVHDWQISREIGRRCSVPIILAGGLTAQNVEEAIRLVRPFAVDVCSGVRTKDRLDPSKLRSFMAAVQAADREERDPEPDGCEQP